ncbi:hypothetical protein L1987_06246 [Smallanthus sonchifolius]|uniref:Uncharacterized protein n=1 Tax=Smallanthus sonchifolius TaxID=185202 RepID=A0ACB9JXL5_9ASTR|nr:hypothetical protein L1987_06246 [Smallanthus sonchifolius]
MVITVLVCKRITFLFNCSMGAASLSSGFDLGYAYNADREPQCGPYLCDSILHISFEGSCDEDFDKAFADLCCRRILIPYLIRWNMTMPPSL